MPAAAVVVGLASRHASVVTTTSRVPSGDHSNASTPRGRSVRRRASPPSSGRRWTCSTSSRSFGSRLGHDGSSSMSERRSEMNASVRAVRREARVAVVPGAEGQLARRAPSRRSGRARGRRDSRRNRARRSGRRRRRSGRPATGAARSRRAGGTGRRGGAVGARDPPAIGTSELEEFSGLPSSHDGRPALAAPRGRPAARSPGPAADAAAPAPGGVRFRRAPVRAVVGRRAGARADRTGRAGRRRRGPGPRRATGAT